MTDREVLEVAEFLGDGISSELSAAVHQVAGCLPLEIRFHPVDLSIERRRRGAEDAYQEAETAIRRHRVAIKYPTITEAESPNHILRQRFDFAVIHRPVKTIPGVKTLHTGKVDVHIVRMAVGGTYEDAGRRIGTEAAVSVRIIERKPSWHANQFAFHLAKRIDCGVISTSKYTIQKETDGFFEEIAREVAALHPEVSHHAELFDALLAKLIMAPENYDVIVTPNEYGDFLSDAACGMIGSIGLGASANYAFTDEGDFALAMFDPAGGTAPDIAGMGVCNPAAVLWAFAMLLTHCGFRGLGSMLDSAVHDTIATGQTTGDLGGTLSTDEFTQAVCATMRTGLVGQADG